MGWGAEFSGKQKLDKEGWEQIMAAASGGGCWVSWKEANRFEGSVVYFHLLKNICYFPLLVLKGIYHYCFFSPRGLNQMEVRRGLNRRQFVYQAFPSTLRPNRRF